MPVQGGLQFGVRPADVGHHTLWHVHPGTGAIDQQGGGPPGEGVRNIPSAVTPRAANDCEERIRAALIAALGRMLNPEIPTTHETRSRKQPAQVNRHGASGQLGAGLRGQGDHGVPNENGLSIRTWTGTRRRGQLSTGQNSRWGSLVGGD